MARILTYPERVSHHNVEKLRQCVSNGPDKYPGARMLTHTDGSMRQVLSLAFVFLKAVSSFDDVGFNCWALQVPIS